MRNRLKRPGILFQPAKLLIAVMAIIGLAGQTRAVDLVTLGTSVQAKAQGGAGLACRDALTGWLINPAAAAGAGSTRVMTSYSGLNGDASYMSLVLVYPTSLAVFSLGWLGVDSGSFIRTHEESGVVVADGEFAYTDNWLVLTVSRQINSWLAAGGQLKYVREEFSSNYGQGQGLVLDFGLTVKMNKSLQAAVAAQNILLRRINWSGEGSEALPLHLKAGLSVDILPNFSLCLDADYCSYYPLIWKAGACFAASEWLDLRAGITQQSFQPGQNKTGCTLGLGLNFDGFSFDYAYCPGLVLENTTAHYFSLSYRFNAAGPGGQSATAVSREILVYDQP